MGADMCLTGMPAADMTEQRKAALVTIIQAMRDDDPSLVDVIESLFLDSAEEGREKLLAAVNELADDFSSRRDVTHFCLKAIGYPLLMTGGLSWGDDPTEAYRTV